MLKIFITLTNVTVLFSELQMPAFEGCREPTLPDKVEILPIDQTNFTVACLDPTTHFPESYEISTVYTCDSISRQWEPSVTDIPNCYGNAYTTCHVLRCRVLNNIICVIIMQNREIYKNIYHKCEDRIEISIPRITVLASGGLPGK